MIEARRGGVAAAGRRLASDPPLLIAVAVLVAIGIASHYGATAPADGSVSRALARQVAYTAIAAMALFGTAQVDYRRLPRVHGLFYAAALSSLLLLLFVGVESFGAQRWFVVGELSLQPSEFARFAAVLTLATIAAERAPQVRTVVAGSLLFVLPTALILVQPDLGSSLVAAMAWLVLLVVWPVPLRVLGALAAALLAIVPLTFALAVPAYQRERLAVFFDPERDPLGSGFALRQVEAAFGSGGLTGRGLATVDSALGGLATRSSDFALAQIGEQLGLVGSLAIVCLFGVVAWRGLAIGTVAPDRLGRMLAVGLTGLLILPAMLHIAVNVRLFPATGVPLPFISPGGSALVVAAASVGLLLSIAGNQPPIPEERWSGARWG